MAGSASASAISISRSVALRNGQPRAISRSCARSPRSSAASSASPVPSHDGSSSRVCVHANTQGIARSDSTPPSPPRRAGRLPIGASADLALGRGRAEVLDEPRVLVDDLRGRRRARCRRRAGPSPRARPAGPAPGGAQRRVEHRRRVDLERAHGDVAQPELRLDHLPLHGDAQPAVDRSGRLRLQREVRRPAAAPDAAAAAVKERQRNARVARRRDDVFLRLVELPVRREPPAVFRGVGVAQHDFRRAARSAARYSGIAEQLAHASAPARSSVATSSNSGTTRRLEPKACCRYSTASTSDGACAIDTTYAPSESGGISASALNVSSTSRTSASGRPGRPGRRSGPRSRACRKRWRSGSVHAEVRVPAQAARDRVERRRMPPRVLADVEADERRAERGEAAQHIRQAALGDRRLPGVDQRLVAELERTAEIDGRVSRAQALEQRQQHGAIRLARAVRGRHERGVGRRDRQLARQGLDLGGEQPRRQRPRRLAGLARDLRRNRRVAVAIAADPRSEHDRRGVERQPASRRGAQRAIERAQVARQGVPHRLLEDEQAAPDFLHRRRPPQPHVFRAPHGEDFAAQVVADVLPLVDRQIRAVLPFQRLRDPHVFRRQAPARDRRRMRRQDDLHPQRDDGLVERIGRDARRPAGAGRSRANEPGWGPAAGSRR